MEKYNVKLLPAAYTDLDEIFDYLLAYNQHAAEKTLDKIMTSLRRLENSPHSGAPLIERSLEKFNFRMLIVDSYIAFYRFIDNMVYVYRILHGARDYASILKQTIE